MSNVILRLQIAGETLHRTREDYIEARHSTQRSFGSHGSGQAVASHFLIFAAAASTSQKSGASGWL